MPKPMSPTLAAGVAAYTAEIAALRKLLALKDAALKPFAEAADAVPLRPDTDSAVVTVADLRRARAACQNKEYRP